MLYFQELLAHVFIGFEALFIRENDLFFTFYSLVKAFLALKTLESDVFYPFLASI
jgi:hypothetical protein